MRRFFVFVFFVSLIATAGTFYWRTYLPEKTTVAAPSQSPSSGGGQRSLDRSPASPSAPAVVKMPSERQDYAVTISIISSVVSAIAAVFQTWLTARAFRR